MPASVRVAWTRLVLSTVYAQEPSVHARLLERVASRHLLEAAGRIAWIPLGVHMEICEALRAEVGDPFYRHYFCATSFAGARLALFRPLVDGFLQLFGTTPLSTIKAAPRVWNAIFRDVGSLRLKALLPKSAEATIVGLDPSLRTSETFSIGVQGAFEAGIAFVGSRGFVGIDTSALQEGRTRFHVRWL